MVWITILFLLLIEICAYIKYRDIMCPAVLHNALWIISLIGATTFHLEDYIDPWSLVMIAAGAVFFQIGFSLSIKTTCGSREANRYDAIIVNDQIIKLLIIIIVIGLIPFLHEYFIYLKSTDDSLYTALRSADENLPLANVISYYRKLVEYLSLAFLAVYWKIDKKQREGMGKYILILFLFAILCVVSVPTRNGILSYMLPLIILYISTHRFSNTKIMVLGSISVIGFMAVFYAISIKKYWYLYEASASPINVVFDEIKVYLSGSIIAIGNLFDAHSYMYNGKNTFRFFMAVADRIFGTSSSIKLTNDFETISDALTTNVFTFYDYYLRDFGPFYAVFMQFVVSVIHGISYKGKKEGNMFQLYMFSLLSYPLVMQFFQDQYFSLLSTWLQVIIIGFIVMKMKVFFIYSDERDKIELWTN